MNRNDWKNHEHWLADGKDAPSVPSSQPPAPHPTTNAKPINPELVVAPAPAPLPTTEQVERWRDAVIGGWDLADKQAHSHPVESVRGVWRGRGAAIQELLAALPSLVERARRADEMEKEIANLVEIQDRIDELRSKAQWELHEAKGIVVDLQARLVGAEAENARLRVIAMDSISKP